MYCSNCGALAGAGDQFCSVCGRKLSADTPEVVDTTKPRSADTQVTATPAGIPNQERPLELAQSIVAPQAHWPPTELARAWPRYWARTFDLFLECFAVIILFARLAPKVYANFSTSLDNPLSLTVVMLPIAMLLDTVIYSAFGNTPGKWLAGIRVLDCRGQKLGFFLYLRRNWKVYVFGLAIGISIIALFTMANNHRKLRAHTQTSWDSELSTRVFQVKPGYWRTYATAGTYVLLLVSLVALSMAVGPSLQRQLQTAAQQVNKKAPYMLDANTRLDGAEALPGLTFQYDYTVVDMSGRSLNTANLAAAFQGSLRRTLVQKACASFKSMLDKGTTIRYRYRDSGGAELGLVAVTSRDCAK